MAHYKNSQPSTLKILSTKAGRAECESCSLRMGSPRVPSLYTFEKDPSNYKILVIGSNPTIDETTRPFDSRGAMLLKGLADRVELWESFSFTNAVKCCPLREVETRAKDKQGKTALMRAAAKNTGDLFSVYRVE